MLHFCVGTRPPDPQEISIGMTRWLAKELPWSICRSLLATSCFSCSTLCLITLFCGGLNASTRVLEASGDRTVGLSSVIKIPSTGGWQIWRAVLAPDIHFSAGRHVLRRERTAADPISLGLSSSRRGLRKSPFNWNKFRHWFEFGQRGAKRH